MTVDHVGCMFLHDARPLYVLNLVGSAHICYLLPAATHHQHDSTRQQQHHHRQHASDQPYVGLRVAGAAGGGRHLLPGVGGKVAAGLRSHILHLVLLLQIELLQRLLRHVTQDERCNGKLSRLTSKLYSLDIHCRRDYIYVIKQIITKMIRHWLKKSYFHTVPEFRFSSHLEVRETLEIIDTIQENLEDYHTKPKMK